MSDDKKKTIRLEVINMSEKLNEEAAPNLNLGASVIKTSKLLKKDHEFSEELSDGGERNEFVEKQSTKRK